jgi:ATP-dependent helicase HrpB
MNDFLPIDTILPQALRTLARNRSLVLKAPPGTGKTTRLPAALLQTDLVPPGSQVLVLEPRRIAARMAAERVARERGGRLGDEVGYRVRFEESVSAATRLCFVTEGVLVRRLQRDPGLAGVAAVVLDEFHERSLEADLSLALLREVQETIRPDLRLVVMSATLETTPLARYLGDCPVLESEGRVYPVEVRYRSFLPDVPVQERACRAVASLWEAGTEASVLVFLPGAAEIRRTLTGLAPLARDHGYDLFPLHGDLSFEAQRVAVLGRGRPRVVIATNVAEASVTVEGIRTVIDAGAARVARFDPWRGLDRLVTERISRSSAEQRAGRAGRQEPGLCLRLYSETDFQSMREWLEPEVCRVDLAGALLQIIAWGSRAPSRFPWLTGPPEPLMERGLRLLDHLGAVAGAEGDRRITATGRSMLRYPLAPRPARVLVEAEARGCGPQVALLTALLSERDLRVARRTDLGTRRARESVEGREDNARFGGIEPTGRSESIAASTHARSDLLVLADLFGRARELSFDPIALVVLGLDPRASRRVALVSEQLGRLLSRGSAKEHTGSHPGRSLGRAPDNVTVPEDSILRSVAAGYPDRMVKPLRLGDRAGVMSGGIGVRLDSGSVVANEELYAALEATPRRDREGRFVAVTLASGVDRSWLPELFPHLVRSTDEVYFDSSASRVAARRVQWLLDLPVEEGETGRVSESEAARLLFDSALGRWNLVMAPSRELEHWLSRLRWLRRSEPKLCEAVGVPEPDELLAEALRRAAVGRRSHSDLRKAPWLEILRSVLPAQASRLLDSHAPARLDLPSGRAGRLDYPEQGPPVLAARLQEFFGSTETPVIAGGRHRVLLHLLAPNQRPVQVTSDLASFWRNLYPAVRSELRRKYPRHAWPEDPSVGKRPGG